MHVLSPATVPLDQACSRRLAGHQSAMQSGTGAGGNAPSVTMTTLTIRLGCGRRMFPSRILLHGLGMRESDPVRIMFNGISFP